MRSAPVRSTPGRYAQARRAPGGTRRAATPARPGTTAGASPYLQGFQPDQLPTAGNLRRLESHITGAAPSVPRQVPGAMGPWHYRVAPADPLDASHEPGHAPAPQPACAALAPLPAGVPIPSAAGSGRRARRYLGCTLIDLQMASTAIAVSGGHVEPDVLYEQDASGEIADNGCARVRWTARTYGPGDTTSGWQPARASLPAAIALRNHGGRVYTTGLDQLAPRPAREHPIAEQARSERGQNRDKPGTKRRPRTGKTPGQDGCAARDLNPEPAD